MINCDSWLKSVWHGVFMPREKRSKFADRWRHFSDPTCTRSLPNEYETGGMMIRFRRMKQVNHCFFCRIARPKPRH